MTPGGGPRFGGAHFPLTTGTDPKTGDFGRTTVRAMVDWWVPVVAGFIGGLLPAGVAGASLWFQQRGRREERAHEREMQRERLTHERAESQREAASVAFESLQSAIRLMSPVHLGLAESDEDVKAVMVSADDSHGRAQAELATLMLHGWSTRVREAVKQAGVALRATYGDFYRHWLFLKSDHLQDENAESMGKVQQKIKEARMAAEELAEAIGE